MLHHTVWCVTEFDSICVNRSRSCILVQVQQQLLLQLLSTTNHFQLWIHHVQENFFQEPWQCRSFRTHGDFGLLCDLLVFRMVAPAKNGHWDVKPFVLKQRYTVSGEWSASGKSANDFDAYNVDFTLYSAPVQLWRSGSSEHRWLHAVTQALQLYLRWGCVQRHCLNHIIQHGHPTTIHRVHSSNAIWDHRWVLHAWNRFSFDRPDVWLPDQLHFQALPLFTRQPYYWDFFAFRIQHGLLLRIRSHCDRRHRNVGHHFFTDLRYCLVALHLLQYVPLRKDLCHSYCFFYGDCGRGRCVQLRRDRSLLSNPLMVVLVICHPSVYCHRYR